VFLLPAAQGWNVVRAAEANKESWNVQAVATLDEAIPLLNGTADLVLGLPVSLVLAQRLRLPTVEDAEFGEMVRIQVEKALPYATEEVTTDFEIIERTEDSSVVSAVAVHNQRLSEIAAPLLARGIIPRQVTVYAAQRAITHASSGRAFMIYRENDSLVCAISEDGKLAFTRSLDGADPSQLQRDLPQLALSAELQGINTSFPVVLLDESLLELQETVQGLFVTRADLIGVECRRRRRS
jgi:Tfp pilus assembly PilM family ATPase